MRELSKAATIGGGIIGSSFTVIFALGGMEVINYNRSKEREDSVKIFVDNTLNQMALSKIIDESKIPEIKSKITYTNNIEYAIKSSDYVQENLPENYEVKQEFIKIFEENADIDAVMGSSTSGLLITEIAKYAKHPKRIVGAHPCNPPHLIPLIEIAQGEKTDPLVADSVKDMFEKLGKKPIILRKEVLGFIANRLQALVFREIIDLVNRGILNMEDADKALTFGPGIRWAIMGPGQIFELGGGKNGLSGLMHHIGPSMESWLEDSSTWTNIRDKAKEKAILQVREAIENRPVEIGNNYDDLVKYRNGMLIEILKLHKDFKIK